MPGETLQEHVHGMSKLPYSLAMFLSLKRGRVASSKTSIAEKESHK